MLNLGKHFTTLWMSQVFSQTAVNILHFTLLLELYQRTHSNFIVGILIFILSICPVVFSGVAGVVADRYNRRLVLMVVNLLRACMVVIMLLTVKFPGLTLVLTFLFTAIAQFFPPAESATIPELVHRDQLITANSLFSFTLYGSFLLGYLIAGPLLEFVGIAWVYAILIGMYLIAFYQNYRLPNITSHLLQSKESTEGVLSIKHAWSNFVFGFKFILTDLLLCPLIILVSLLFGLERGAASLIPELATKILNYTNFEISLYLILPLGLGTVVGALLMNKLKRNVSRPVLILAGSLIETIVFASFIFVSVYPAYQSPLVFLYAFLVGLGDVFLIVGTQTLIQEKMGTEIRGRAFGVVLTTMNVIGLPIILFLSYLGNRTDLLQILSTGGVIGTVVVLVVGSYLFTKSLLPTNPRSLGADQMG